MSGDLPSLEQAYAWCRRRTRSHYENFPVASLALPRRLRRPVTVIYAFARAADDVADEGRAATSERLARLDEFRAQLDRIRARQPVRHPIFIALQHMVGRCSLDLQPFYDLLTAFRMDVIQNRYETQDQVLEYCRYSANPVGRLVLMLAGHYDSTTVSYSDAVCTALQLVNFLQDLGEDFRDRNRIYLPADDMKRFGVTEADIARRRDCPAIRQLVDLQSRRADTLLRKGMPLGSMLKGRLGFELRFTIEGGLMMVDKLNKRNSVFERPLLTGVDRLKTFLRACRRSSSI